MSAPAGPPKGARPLGGRRAKLASGGDWMSAPAGPPQGRAAPSGGGEQSSLRGETIRKLVVVGVGLIGGSAALALKARGASSR
jgi:NADPH-dependent 2,4-dienoyl-CoA reductase/sulfur reductase-like enzyme